MAIAHFGTWVCSKDAGQDSEENRTSNNQNVSRGGTVLQGTLDQQSESNLKKLPHNDCSLPAIPKKTKCFRNQ